ncbi:MAG: hypothetical protein H5T69_12695 [Chloroflexi bacterium]|nr:hypothetical protein [Chloroflexota bacterium]
MGDETYSFIIRIWHEEPDHPEQSRDLVWRGYIEHVGHGQILHFQDLEGIIRFVQEQTGMATSPPRRSWRQRLRLSK